MVSVLHRLVRSLEFRLLVPLAATVTLVLAVHALLGYWSIRQEVSRFVRADLERSTSLIENATHDGMLLNRMDEVQTRIERLGSSPSFSAVRVYAKNGRIALSAQRNERNLVFGISAGSCQACHQNGRVTGSGVLDHRVMVERRDGSESQRCLTVIRNGPTCSTVGCHAPASEKPVLGVLEVEMTMAPFDEAISRARHELILTTAALILASGVVTALVIRRLVHKPVARLREGTRRIAAGDLDTQIEVLGRDQLAMLAVAFNRMVSDLKGARDELRQWSETLEEKVQQKTLALRQAQQQLIRAETMVSLGKLSATVAHELNNPLSGVLAYARLVRRELAAQPLDSSIRAEIDSYLTLVDKECVRCGDIVKNLLVFARGSSMRLASANINDIIELSLMLVRHHLEVHHIRCQTTLLQGDAAIVADKGQLQQAVLALLMNAIEAMLPNSGREAVLGVEAEGDDEHITIRIRDTGVGIPPDLLPHIFEPFVTTKGETSGVGLGLSVVYGVIHGHNGQITVQSQPNIGTTFTVTLPRRRSDGTGGTGLAVSVKPGLAIGRTSEVAQ